jgi:uncharacterized protein (TIGR02246 family)
VAVIAVPRRVRFVLAAAALGASACRQVPTPPPAAGPSMRDEILASLTASAAAWNRGDLSAFMSDYLDGSRATYVTKTGVLHGGDSIRAHYLKSYAAQFHTGAKRDSLTFQETEVDSLAPNVANVITFYVLTRGDSVVAKGPFSGVFVKQDGRWRIAHDHSS